MPVFLYGIGFLTLFCCCLAFFIVINFKKSFKIVKAVLEHLLIYRIQWYILAWKIKSSWGLPLIGDYLQVIKSGNPMKFFHSYIWPNYESPTLIWNGPFLNMVIGDSETANAILNSPIFLHKNMVYKLIGDCIGNNLVTLHYDKWKVHRKLLDPSVNSYKNMQVFIPSIVTAADNLINEFDKLVGQNEVEIHEKILYVISNGTARNIFGEIYDFENNPEHKDIFDSIIRVQKLSIERAYKVWLYPDVFYRWSNNYKEVVELNIKFDKILFGLLDRYKDETPTSVRDLIMELNRKNLLDKLEARDELGIFFAASTETTASLVYYVIMCLAMHPEYQEKVFNELIKVIPNIDEDVKQENLPLLTYLDMVINETMRLLPPIPMIGRNTIKSFKLNDEITIPKGVQIIIDIHKIHRNEKDWGPKANEFNPENFSKENIEQRHPSAFLPFSKGARNCIGAKYAKFGVRMTLAKILRKYEFKTSTKLKDIVIEEDIVGRLEHYPPIQIIKRSY